MWPCLVNTSSHRVYEGLVGFVLWSADSSSLNMLSACLSARVMPGFLVTCWASVRWFMVERVKNSRQRNRSDSHFHGVCGITKESAVKTATPWEILMAKFRWMGLWIWAVWWLRRGWDIFAFVMPVHEQCWSGGMLLWKCHHECSINILVR